MITVAGIGPGGTADYLFDQTKTAICQADWIIGSQRQLEIVPEEKAATCMQLPKKLTELEVFLQEHMTEAVVLLASGDPLTYGIGKWLSQRFPAKAVTILPGISSIHFLFSRLRLPLEDCFITSSHGKLPDFDLLFQLPKVGMVTDQKIGPYQLAQEAVKRGKRATFFVGENLSYSNERIRQFLAEEVPDEDYRMNVVVIINER